MTVSWFTVVLPACLSSFVGFGLFLLFVFKFISYFGSFNWIAILRKLGPRCDFEVRTRM